MLSPIHQIHSKLKRGRAGAGTPLFDLRVLPLDRVGSSGSPVSGLQFERLEMGISGLEAFGGP